MRCVGLAFTIDADPPSGGICVDHEPSQAREESGGSLVVTGGNLPAKYIQLQKSYDVGPIAFVDFCRAERHYHDGQELWSSQHNASNRHVGKLMPTPFHDTVPTPGTLDSSRGNLERMPSSVDPY